jgi:sigma-E factor negative regulatory protein RseC
MAIEQGIVTKLGNDPDTVWVKTTACSACAACSARNSCNEAGKIEDREVQAINAAGASVGDRIQLSISTGSLLKAAFLLYLFPVICMLFGGLTGNAMAGRFSIDPSLLSMSAAVLSLAAAMFFVRYKGTKLGSRTEYRPRIIRILGRSVLSEKESGHP